MKKPYNNKLPLKQTSKTLINKKNQRIKLIKLFKTSPNVQKMLLMNYHFKLIMPIMIYKASKNRLKQEINLLRLPLMVQIHRMLHYKNKLLLPKLLPKMLLKLLKTLELLRNKPLLLQKKLLSNIIMHGMLLKKPQTPPIMHKRD